MSVLTGFAIVHTICIAIINLTPTPEPGTKLAGVYKVIEALAGVMTALAKDPGKDPSKPAA